MPIGEAGNASPRWSPDGSQVAFAAGRGGIGIVDVSSGAVQLVPITSGNVVDSLTWVREGKSIVYETNGLLREVSLSDGSIRDVVPGSQPEICPSPIVTRSLETLITEKEAAIKRLKNASYKSAYGVEGAPIPAYDESSAEALVVRLKQSDPVTVPPEQVTAFSRFVLQEQTLAETLADYSALSNYQADTTVDLAGMYWGTAFLIAKAKAAPASAIRDLALKTAKDGLILSTGWIPDKPTREQWRDGFSLVFGAIASRTDNSETFFQILVETGLREEVASQNMRALVKRVQPTLDQGVRSVDGGPGETWCREPN